MAYELKTKITDQPVAAFIDTIPEAAKRADALALVQLMQEETGEPPVMWGTSIIGFGKMVYKYASGQTGEWMVAGFSPRKQQFSLYLGGEYNENRMEILSRLGKHKTGKGCIYIKSLKDIHIPVLRELIRRSKAGC